MNRRDHLSALAAGKQTLTLCMQAAVCSLGLTTALTVSVAETSHADDHWPVAGAMPQQTTRGAVSPLLQAEDFEAVSQFEGEEARVSSRRGWKHDADMPREAGSPSPTPSELGENTAAEATSVDSVLLAPSGANEVVPQRLSEEKKPVASANADIDLHLAKEDGSFRREEHGDRLRRSRSGRPGSPDLASLPPASSEDHVAETDGVTGGDIHSLFAHAETVGLSDRLATEPEGADLTSAAEHEQPVALDVDNTVDQEAVPEESVPLIVPEELPEPDVTGIASIEETKKPSLAAKALDILGIRLLKESDPQPTPASSEPFQEGFEADLESVPPMQLTAEEAVPEVAVPALAEERRDEAEWLDALKESAVVGRLTDASSDPVAMPEAAPVGELPAVATPVESDAAASSLMDNNHDTSDALVDMQADQQWSPPSAVEPVPTLAEEFVGKAPFADENGSVVEVALSHHPTPEIPSLPAEASLAQGDSELAANEPHTTPDATSVAETFEAPGPLAHKVLQPEVAEVPAAEVPSPRPLQPINGYANLAESTPRQGTPTLAPEMIQPPAPVPAAPTTDFGSAPLQKLKLPVRGTLRLPADAGNWDVIVEDTQVCDIIRFKQDEISLIGKKVGTTRLQLRSKQGATEATSNYLVTVNPQMETDDLGQAEYAKLRQLLSDLYPDCRVRLIPEVGRLTVVGTVTCQEEAVEILRLVRSVRLIPVVDKLTVDRLASQRGYSRLVH